MKQYERFMAALSLSSVALLTMGVNRCQESYNFAAQSTVATETPTGSVTSSLVTQTATPNGTETPSGTRTISLTPGATTTADATPTEDDEDNEPATVDGDEFFQISARKEAVGAGADVLGALSQLGEDDKSTASDSAERSNDSTSGSAAADSQVDDPKNWLGKAFSGKPEVGTSEDTDGDSFTDLREEQFGTDPQDPNSFPPVRVTTDLSQRLLGADDDGDGLSNQEEMQIGTDPHAVDSDGDGVFDGAEIRSSTDPLKNNSHPVDSDGDGLSDEYERSRGLDWRNLDADGDGLRDDLELAMGTDITIPDTDGDGILDGKEVAIGSDPTVAEQQ